MSTVLVGDQIKLARKEQLKRLQSATVFGYIDSSITEPADFFQLAGRGADVLLIDSGVILQNLAVRSAIERLAHRPILLWVKTEEHGSITYVMDESLEAGISGADGVVFRHDDLTNISELAENIEKCREHGMTSVIRVETDEQMNIVAQLRHPPDAVITNLDIKVVLNNTINIPLRNANDLPAQISRDRIVEPTLFTRFQDIPEVPRTRKYSPLVKVCGIKTVEAAQVACESGADMIGMILVPGRARTVNLEDARAISKYVHSFERPLNTPYVQDPDPQERIASMSIFEANSHIMRASTRQRPKLVGVFRNQPLESVIALQRDLQLDLVQFHGSEPLGWCRMIPCPVIRRFTPDTPEFDMVSIPGYHYMSLLDSEKGGEGKLVDWSVSAEQMKLGARFILAGGLTPDNVQDALQTPGVYGVDVSGGVEINGQKDMDLIRKFVTRAKDQLVCT